MGIAALEDKIVQHAVGRVLSFALPNAELASLGLFSLAAGRKLN